MGTESDILPGKYLLVVKFSFVVIRPRSYGPFAFLHLRLEEDFMQNYRLGEISTASAEVRLGNAVTFLSVHSISSKFSFLED